ncbi:MAG TPA: PDZ domain-containing protein [Saprospiraceae bacterium]|nr:PDZ domain-containing protein [Saprospiraceae bacterium]
MTTKNLLIILSTSLISAIFAVFLFATYSKNQRLQQDTYLPVKLTSYDDAIFSGKLQRKFLSSAPTNFIEAAKRVTPAVVNIKALQGVGSTIWGRGSGSGVLISPDGYIVTNLHVIDNSAKIEIALDDRREYEADIVGYDKSSDIALLKIDGNNFPHIIIGNSDSVQVGEWVLAVGNPFNLQSTVTTGIISAKSRNINILDADNPIESFIQTDAVINPGNSGGALVNTNGELIGINTAIVTESGRYEGYSFAIPSNLIRKVIKDLKEFGEVKRGFLGINIKKVNDEEAKKLGLDKPNGVYVTRVVKNSGADNAGIQMNDVILKINNKEINSTPELQELVARFRPGNKLVVDIFRDGAVQQLTVRLQGIKKENVNFAQKLKPFFKKYGFEARNLTTSEKRISGTEGVKVISITKGGKVADTNMEIGYIITSVNNNSIHGLYDLLMSLSATKNAENITFEGIYEEYQGIYQYSFSD